MPGPGAAGPVRARRRPMDHRGLAGPCPVADHACPTVAGSPPAVGAGREDQAQAADMLCGPHPLGTETSTSL